MTGMRPDERPLKIQGLLGVGFDGRQDAKRVTRGKNFFLLGGSKHTHRQMVDVALKFNELVDKRGKSIHEVNARELGEITRELAEDL